MCPSLILGAIVLWTQTVASVVSGHSSAEASQPSSIGVWQRINSQNENRHRGRKFGDDDEIGASKWSNFDANASSTERDWRNGDAHQSHTAHDAKDAEKEERGWASDERETSHFDGDNGKRQSRDRALKTSNEAEGTKKFAHFVQGSGPDGFYSRGVFGTNGFEHEAERDVESETKMKQNAKKSSRHDDARHAHDHHAHKSDMRSRHRANDLHQRKNSAEEGERARRERYGSGRNAEKRRDRWHSTDSAENFRRRHEKIHQVNE